MTRPYTVKEIDELRYIISLRRVYFSSYISENQIKQTEQWNIAHANRLNLISYRALDNVIRQAPKAMHCNTQEEREEVENLLRTYMLAGVTAQEILEQDKQRLIEQEDKK